MHQSKSPSLPETLDRGTALLASLGAEFAGEQRRLRELGERLSQGRFHLAVLGQFKRGKSTLLNALLGEPILPSSVVPVTAIPTFLRAGDTPGVRVLFQDARLPEARYDGTGTLTEFLAGYVTESGNPKNQRGVSQVEVEYPAAILRRGVVLIDTPGIGSTFQHNTEATLNFLPQCDAALFLVSADPPMTAVEAEFLKEVRAKVPRLFFVLNKMDQLDDAERQTALAFLRRGLTEQAGISADAPIFCVSARQALAARRAGDTGAWTRSGLAELERHLVEFLAEEKTATLRDAVSRKAADVLAAGRMRLGLAIRSLELPVEDLQRRLAVFEQKLREIEQERIAAADRLAGDRQRLYDFLQQYSEELSDKARAYLDGVLEGFLTRNGSATNAVSEDAARAAVADAIPGFFEHHLGAMTELFKKRIGETLQPHRQRADQLTAAVHKTAAELFDVPYAAVAGAESFELVKQPYWVTHQWNATLSPISPGTLDRLMPLRTRLRRIRQRLRQQIELLVIRNVENARWATYQSIDQKFYDFGKSLDERLADTIAATHGAIRAALDKRAQHRDAMAADITRLRAAAGRLAELRDALRPEAQEQP